MNLSILYDSLALIKPEIAISIALILLVLFDLIFHHDKRIIKYIAGISVLVTFYFVYEQFGLRGFSFQTDNIDLITNGMVAVDGFASFFKVIILLSTVFIIFFSNSSLEIQQSNDRIGEYYALIFGMILGMFFMVSANDLILIYLSLELMSLSSYVLAGFVKIRDRNSEASLKYIIYGSVSSGLMLFGISLVFGLTGTTNLLALKTFLLASSVNPVVFGFAIILIVAGIGYKISSAPFHFWTPDVYEGAPITITAYLSVASKAAGFALLVRFIKVAFVYQTDSDGHWVMLQIFDWQTLIIILSILTMTLGNFAALWQNNIKRLLAYSSIAHAGYLLLGLAVLSDQGVIALLIYFFFYLLMNLGAFYVVMLISDKIGSEDIHDYNGIGPAAPFLGVALTIFLISLTGLPPTAGFIGKLYIFIALVDAKMIAVAIIALLNTVVSLYYYVRVLKHMYLTKVEEQRAQVNISAWNLIVALLLLIPVLVFGVYFSPIVDFAQACNSLLSGI